MLNGSGNKYGLYYFYRHLKSDDVLYSFLFRDLVL